MQHRNAPLTPNGRRRLVALVEDDGLTFAAAAAAANVSRSTVHTWVTRWRQAGEEGRRSLACLRDRSSRPRTSPRMLSEADHDRCCEVRRRTGWGPRLVASEVGIPHATVHRALRRRGCSRRPRAPRQKVVRYEWPCPGNLLHVDTKRHARFVEPGHAVTGTRTRGSRGAGWEFVHTIVDDCSRLAYAEIHDDERAATVTAFTHRALDWFLGRGIVAERLLSDNAWTYVKNKGLAQLLADRGIEHWRTKPYSPQTNGKVERLQQTMDREWARGLSYRSSTDRRAALPHWLDHYNESRRHSALGNRPPMARVRDVLGHDI
ncbi:MAG TPA: IS481 family transposase [Solirubrobacterales bacterium]|nr:IS481 family transposase [Solirubrobacterales bacterium]